MNSIIHTYNDFFSVLKYFYPRVFTKLLYGTITNDLYSLNIGSRLVTSDVQNILRAYDGTDFMKKHKFKLESKNYNMKIFIMLKLFGQLIF
jgi:hypothetical protein